MSQIKQHKEGLIAAVIFHVLILLILLNSAFFTPLPLPEEKGFLVDFGTSDNGLGAEEPAPAQPAITQPEPQQSAPEEIPVPPTPKPTAKPKAEEIMTQDYEQTAALEEAKRKKQKEEEAKKLEEERIRQENLEKQRKIAEEREKRRKDSIRKAEEKAKADAINSLAQGAFSKSGTNTNGTTGAGSGTSTSQGVTYGGGNQGSPNGSAGAGNYGNGGGDGISFSLTGRSMRSMVRPTYTENEEGTVVVEITVDINGNVISANPGVKGTTTTNQKLYNAAKRAAIATKFSVNKDAPAQQVGKITYKFTLN